MYAWTRTKKTYCEWIKHTNTLRTKMYHERTPLAQLLSHNDHQSWFTNEPITNLQQPLRTIFISWRKWEQMNLPFSVCSCFLPHSFEWEMGEIWVWVLFVWSKGRGMLSFKYSYEIKEMCLWYFVRMKQGRRWSELVAYINQLVGEK